jgi:uncharacterized membrane protein HdeD (DUF308 family)
MPKRRNKAGVRTLLFGLLSITLYAALFAHPTAVAKFFARGSWYAIFPIATVFLFSFVHGTFASNVWTFLGIEARKTAEPRSEKRKVLPKRKRPRPRVQLRAD